MFYLMMHSTHFSYGRKEGQIKRDRDKKGEEGNILFNDSFNTFYLWLYRLKCCVVSIQSDDKYTNSSPKTSNSINMVKTWNSISNHFGW